MEILMTLIFFACRGETCEEKNITFLMPGGILPTFCASYGMQQMAAWRVDNPEWIIAEEDRFQCIPFDQLGIKL